MPKIRLKSSASAQPTYKSWPIVSDVSCSGNEELEPVEFLQGSESYLAGDKFQDRARELGAEAGGLAGEGHAELLLAMLNSGEAQLDRKYYHVFPGTVRRDPYGGLCAPCLLWFGERWYLLWGWLVGRWYRFDRVVLLCKS